MDDLYNKFRFTRKDIFRGRSESMVQFVFFQISFFLEYHECGDFSNSRLTKSVDMAAESAGILIPDKAMLIHQVMDFFCEELGFKGTFSQHYSEIYEMILIIVMDHISDGYKFIEPLTRMIIDEFDKAECSTILGEVVAKLQNTAQFRFLPYDLLEDAVISVYDLFSNPDSEDF